MKSITKSAISKYVIVRSRNEGLNAGTLVKADETGCVLKNARRLWYTKPKDNKQAWYEGVANSGVSEDSRLSPSVKRKYIIEGYSITECSDLAMVSIVSAEAHES